jgi:anti-anti-sigma factor
MRGQAVGRPQALSVVVRLPDVIDVNNARRVGNDLYAAMRPGFGVVIADMTATAYCDVMGIRCLLEASSRATAWHAELRLVLSSAAVLRLLRLARADLILRTYPSMDVALSAQPVSALRGEDHPALPQPRSDGGPA